MEMEGSSGNFFKISNCSKSSLPENLNCIGKYEQNVHQFGPVRDQDNMQGFGRNGHQQSGSRISVASPSTSEYNEDGVSNDSEDEVFQYPPLKIISKKPKVSSMDGVSQNSKYLPTDLSKPVFSAPFFDECLNQREPPGTNISTSLYFGSSAVSLRAPATQTHPGFICSGDSQTSFLLPAETVQAILPVSKSVMDLLVILQRICGFSNSLVTTVFNFGLTPSSGQTSRQLSTDPLEREEKTSRRRSSASTKRDVVGSQATATSKKIESSGLTSSYTDGNFIPIQKSNLLPCSSLSGKRLTSATLISVSSCEDDVNDGNDVGAPDSDVGAPSTGVGATGIDAGAPSSDVGASGNDVGAPGNESCDPKLQFNRYKCLLHLHLQKTMCHLLTTYSINMLCMDLCATPKNASRRLIGQKLIEAIDIYQKAGLVWSCRHQVEKTHPCLYYHNRKAQYLSERHEPITQHMCTRINNVFACLHTLEVYHVKLKEVMAVDSCPPSDGANCGQNSSIPVLKNGYWPESLNDEESLHDLKTSSDPQLHSYWFQESLQVKEMTRQHLMSVLCGMCRLLAFKLNLFVKDALPLVLRKKDTHSTIAESLAPVTTFLQKHLDSFSTWLYRDCFRRVLENIWVYIVQDIESHTAKLLRCEPPSSPQAQMWMLVISHFMTFMNNGGQGINRDLLLAQASYVLLELELHTLSTVHLVALCQSLREYSTEGENTSWENVDTKRPPAIIHKIFKELQSLRKCFSGAELVKWILKNRDALPADMVLPSEPLTKESATAICQSLLDQNFIVDLDTEFFNSRSSPSYSRDGVSPYPELSLHSTGTDWEYRNSRGGVSPSDQDSLSDASGRSLSVTPTQEVDAVSPSVTPTQDVNTMSPSVSPTQDVNTMSPSVTPTLDVDQVSHNVSPKQEVIEGMPCNLTQTQDQNERIIRNGNLVDSGTTQIPPKFRRRSTEVMCEVDTAFQKAIYKSLAHPQDNGNITTQDGLTAGLNTSSMANDHYSMDQMRRFSTFASLSEITNGSGKFMADAETFYLVHHSFQLQGFDIAAHYTNQWNYPVSEYDHQLHRARVSSENLALVERCFMHKVSPLTILAIISGRKKTDSLAKVFIKQLPQSTLDRINILLDEPGVNCTSS
ncbi:unnamed protein product [Lymnaea stagnalis]|uniref:Uncharacterized protein n=1 Tax=Lymnaea stagnalis TaxID=6523 RepID=A0AAV2IF04_LYMST